MEVCEGTVPHDEMSLPLRSSWVFANLRRNRPYVQALPKVDLRRCNPKSLDAVDVFPFPKLLRLEKGSAIVLFKIWSLRRVSHGRDEFLKGARDVRTV